METPAAKREVVAHLVETRQASAGRVAWIRADREDRSLPVPASEGRRALASLASRAVVSSCGFTKWASARSRTCSRR